MKIKEEYSLLFELGCDDLKLVEKNLQDKKIKARILLFHLQQAAEKFLKSLLSFYHLEFPKTHDIEALIELCGDNKIDIPENIEELIKLTPFAVEFRYGLAIDETLDINYFYQRVSELKRFIERIMSKAIEDF